MTPFTMSKSVVTSMMSYQSLLLPESFHAPNPDVAPPTTQERKGALQCSSTLGCCSGPDDQNCTQMVLFQELFKETTKSAVLFCLGFCFVLFCFVLCVLFLHGLIFPSNGRLSQIEKKKLSIINQPN